MRKILYKSLGVLGRGEVNALEKASYSPLAAQTERLLAILQENAHCQFGRQHNFSTLKTIADFQKAVPISDYDKHRPFIDDIAAGKKSVLTTESPHMFATTSGTTGAQKLIPITRGYMKEFRRASIVSGFNLLKDHPGLVNGVALTVFSPAEEGRTSGGIPFGAISGKLFQEEPAVVKRYISPLPYEVCLIKDYESRYYTILRLALCLPVSVFMTLNPSTIVLLAKRLKTYGPNLVKDIAEGTITPPQPLPEHVAPAVSKLAVKNPERARELSRLLENNQFVPHMIWPTLNVICCWTKAAASFYLMDFPELFADLPVSDVTYGASEGRGSVYMGKNRQMLAVRSHFYEFIPEAEIESANPTVLVASDLEVGQNYHILFTTSGGLYRYHLNDVIKIVGMHNQTPLIEFQYKGGNVSSFTGEKITELQVTKAMSATLNELNIKARFFSLIPEFRPEPHYELYFEAQSDTCPNNLASAFDRQLANFNSEYATKRESERLSPVELKQLHPGTYEALRKKLVASGVPDSQIKISHLNPKDDLKAILTSSVNHPVHR